MWRLLSHPGFRRLWLAGLLSRLGSQVSRIALLLHLVETGGSVSTLALLVVLETLPGLLAAPLAGVVIDRCGQWKILVGADLVRAALLGMILLHPGLEMIFATAALLAVAGAFFDPARSSALPLVVRSEELADANGLDQSASNAVMILGPVLGAWLLSLSGLGVALRVDLASFLASALLVARVPIRRVADEGTGLSLAAATAELRSGWRYLARHRLALQLNGLLFLALVCTSVWVPLAPFFIRDRLGGPEGALGWQLGVFGVGAVLGALWIPRVMREHGRGATVFAGFLAEGSCLFLYSLASSLGSSLVLVFLWGLAVSVIVVPFYSILQDAVDELFLGRVFAVVKQSESCAALLAMGLAAALQDRLGSHLILAAAGLLYVACTLLSVRTRGGRALLATT